MNFSDDTLSIRSNRTQFEQIIINIITNAIYVLKAQASGTRCINIFTERQNGNAFIKICDSGPGIPEKVIDYVFDPFFTTKDPGAGMGLGLAITQNIIRGIGGEITVGNKNNGGACFAITLPINLDIEPVSKRVSR